MKDIVYIRVPKKYRRTFWEEETQRSDDAVRILRTAESEVCDDEVAPNIITK